MKSTRMTIEEAIGRIQDHIRIHSKKEPFTPYLDEAFAMAIEALKEKPQWIPCSERLPKKDGYYLITRECFSDNRLKVGMGAYVINTQCFYPHALAWMPFPAPYEEEGEEK